MADTQDDWSADSNDAVHISLVIPGDGALQTLHSFHPKMTYSIFGEEERIFGYQGLRINLRYNACDMRPSAQIMYTKKFKTVGETAPTDLRAILESYLPKMAFEKSSVFETAIADGSYANWKPPGELCKTIEAGGQTYEVWKGSLADLMVQQLVKRIQILVPLFIEGGTFINLDDPEWSLERWTVFFLYQKKTTGVDSSISPYTFMGCSTVYQYFFYQPITPPSSPSANKQRIQNPATLDFELPRPGSFSSFPCRSRISQFVILPPFQGSGNGSRFYNAIFDFFSQETQTLEITVEDPNDAFDDLRDVNDLVYLRTIPEFSALRLNTKVNPRAGSAALQAIMDLQALEQLRTEVKIAPRQFSRVIEMQLLSLIPIGVRQSLMDEKPNITGAELAAKQHEYRLWQLFVKTRLYRHNKSMLVQLERGERFDKLEETLGVVETDYARLLRAADKNARSILREQNSNGESMEGTETAKRSSPNDAAEETGEPSAKRVKFV